MHTATDKKTAILFYMNLDSKYRLLHIFDRIQIIPNTLCVDSYITATNT